jgi:hypothetical protein
VKTVLVDKAQLDSWTLQAMSPELSEQERKFRDEFVREFLIDYNPFEAALRLGFSKEYATEYAAKFMNEPYVQKRIKEMELEGGIEEDADRNKRKVMAALFREANYKGPGSSHSARVSALSKLSTIFGMEAPVKTKTELMVTSPVTFYIPSNGREDVVPTPSQPATGAA